MRIQPLMQLTCFYVQDLDPSWHYSSILNCRFESLFNMGQNRKNFISEKI